jgi:hypothetical protein
MKAEVFVSEPVLQVLRLYDGLIDEEAWTRTACEQIEQLADRLLDGHCARLPGAAVELHNWLQSAGKLSTQELFDLSLSRSEAFETVARAHGFVSWREAEFVGRNRGDPVFERAIEDLLAGDILGLEGALDRAPDLVVRRSHYGHRATLLHYLSANGVETYRQRVPLNASAIAAILIQRGADVLATASMYGKNQTVRGLLLSSGHPRAAGVTNDVLAVIDGATGAAQSL